MVELCKKEKIKKTVGIKSFVNLIVRWYFESGSLLDFLTKNLLCWGYRHDVTYFIKAFANVMFVHKNIKNLAT